MGIQDFIGKEAWYDKDGTVIWGVRQDGSIQLLLDVRGFGAIQDLFTDKEGSLDLAVEYQDKLGEWIVDAINKKLKASRTR